MSDIQCHLVTEVIEDGLAFTQIVPTSAMISDLFTKSLMPATF